MSLSTDQIRKTKKNSLLLSQAAHDHSAELKRLSRIKGQVEGVERMILEKRYCPEIVHQIKAIRSALRSLEANVVEGHMRHCVKAAIKSRDPEIVQEKMEEILLIMKGQG